MWSKGHDLKCPSEGHRWLVPVQERLPSDWQTVTTDSVKSCGNCLLPHICWNNPDFWDIITILWNGSLVSNTSRMWCGFCTAVIEFASNVSPTFFLEGFVPLYLFPTDIHPTLMLTCWHMSSSFSYVSDTFKNIVLIHADFINISETVSDRTRRISKEKINTGAVL
jgi:hypothetical protein